MVDPVALVGAVGTFLGGAASLSAVLLATRRTSTKERNRAANNSARLLEAAKDGQITPEEAADLLRDMHDGRGDEG